MSISAIRQWYSTTVSEPNQNRANKILPKAVVVEENQLRHLLKVSAVSGESPIRNVALADVLYCTGMMLTEIGSITVRDYLREDGSVRASSEVRAAIAYNSNARVLHRSSPRVVAALDAYLAERVPLSHGSTVRKAAFRGLDPDGQLFRRGDGEPFQLTARKASTGILSYSCDSLSQLYRKLHSQAGLHGPNALAGRPFGFIERDSI